MKINYLLVMVMKRQLLTNKSLREELSQVGLKRAELFSWDASAEKVWLILENTITGK